MSTPKQITVAIDTMILVWGTTQKGKQEYLNRTKMLFKALVRENARIVLPAIVAAEYLTGVKPDEQGKVLAEMSDQFFVAPFDAKCAHLASALWLEGSKTRTKGKPDSRVCLRADTLIIATAKTSGAKRFYSHDANCRKLAEKAKMLPFDLPMNDETLFDMDEPNK